MEKRRWKSKIKTACKRAGTYKQFFDPIIDSLAEIMELRDKAKEKFEESGGEIVVEYTNKNGSTNTVKNPALVVVMECNTQALAYWRDLGLTPAGLKRINEGGLKPITEKNGKTMIEIMREKHRKEA